jgi:hypothetical protein
MSVMTISPLIGPTIGPVLSGYGHIDILQTSYSVARTDLLTRYDGHTNLEVLVIPFIAHVLALDFPNSNSLEFWRVHSIMHGMTHLPGLTAGIRSKCPTVCS